MMDVGIMRMAMADRQVSVRVAVRFAAVPGEVVLMLVVQIVAVAVRMFVFFMRMRMLVAFRQMQPDADTHQSGCQPEQAADRFMQYQQRYRRTDEWRC